MRVIKNKTAKMLIVTVPAASGRGRARIELKPGRNEIADDIAAAAMETAGFRMFARQGLVRVIGAAPAVTAKQTATPSIDDLRALKAKEALAAAAQLSDLGLLDKWLAVEERATVKAAIAKRIGTLNPSATVDDEPETDSEDEGAGETEGGSDDDSDA